MQTVEQMADFVALWDSVQELQLSNNPDTIAWGWTADGVYTAKSAYKAQFLGSYSHSEVTTSGRQKLKASTGSLPGFWFRAKF